MGKRTNNTDHVGFTGSITKIWVAINSLITSVANIPIYTLPSTIEVAQINEKVNGDGVNIEGIGFNNNIMYSDTIKEYNSDHGVTIDGLLIKDSTIPGFILPLVPAMGTITATGTTAATAFLLTGVDFYEVDTLAGGGVNGVALIDLYTNVVLGKEIYIANTSGSNMKIYGSNDGVLQICVASYNSVSESFSMATNKLSCFKYVGNGKWIQIVII